MSNAPERILTPLDHARDLMARGLAPIPVPHGEKGPKIPGWPALRLVSDDLPRYFEGGPANVGTLLGESAGWIVDVDLDHPRAVELADRFLPPTSMVWGRGGKPRSHRLYRLTRPADTKKWPSKAAGMIVELRSSGCQTIAPGSVHPSGEAVRWDSDGEPATIDPDHLIAALAALANAVRAELGEGPDTPGAPADRPASPMPRGTSRYGREALRREAATVAEAPEGARNDTLNRAAFSVGTLIGGGEVHRTDAEAELLAAARSCGLPEAEARRTIASGMESGLAHPRQRPAQAVHTSHERRADAAVPVTSTPEPVPAFAPIAASDLIRDYPDLRPVVIADLLREGEVMNVVAAPKVGKSWLVHSLAVAVVSGRDWLEKATTRGRALLIDGELHLETLAKRLRSTQATVGDSDMAALEVWSVRGQRLTIDAIAVALHDVPTRKYRLIVVDALYRFLPMDGEENANETMTRVYNTLDGIAKRSGASVVVVHHATKGNQSDKAVTDVGAGAGSQSRAADTHLILRPHEEDDAVVVDAAVRSFPPMDSFVIRSMKPGWALAPDLDPTLLRKPLRRGKPVTETKPLKAPPMAPWSPERFAAEIVGHSRFIRDEVVARAKERGLGKGQAESLLRRAEQSHLVYRHHDGPSAPHQFSVEPPARFADTREGGRVGASPAPGADAPGGVGGKRATPLPPPDPLCSPDGSPIRTPEAEHIMAERLGIADELELPAHPGSAAWIVAAEESRRDGDDGDEAPAGAWLDDAQRGGEE